MAADIYTMFRRFIGDYTPDYTLPDLESLAFLDLGIDKCSEVLNNIVVEDIAISSADIVLGYKALSYDIVTIIDTELGLEGEHIYWETDGDNKIIFLDTDFITAGTYEFRYKARYTNFDGVVKGNGDLNHPTNANLVVSKSEEGMSVSYGTGTALRLSSPTELKLRAMEIFNSISNKSNISFSVTV